MNRLIDTLRAAEAARPLFQRGARWIHAGQVRASALAIAARIDTQPGDVFVHVESAAQLTAALLAAALRGRALVLPAHAQSAYLAEIGCAAPALLTEDCIAAPTPGADAPAGAFAAAADDVAVHFFTSGSTGAPKRVETTLSRLEIQTRTLHRLWGADAGHACGTVSHQHIYGLLFRVLWPLLSGRTADDQAALYWEDLEPRLTRAVTLISSPAHLTRLPPHAGPLAAPPALVFSSGQALPLAAARACAAWFGQAPIEVLGSTETGGIGWRRQSDADAPWTPLPDVDVSSGEEEALEVRSPYLMDDQPQRTGDAVALLSDGRFRLRPRADRIEKIDGKRVSLARVEAAARALPDIAEAVALALPRRKQALALITTLTEQGRAALAQQGAFRLSRALRGALAAALEPAERPKHWRFVEAIPQDSQGKRVLSRLQALFEHDPLGPLALDIQMRGPHAAEIRFALSPRLIYFDGHFPARPILPGLAQVHIARLLAERLWRFEPPSADLSRMKFRRVLRPEDQVLLKLVLDETKGVLRFSYFLGDLEASQGELGGQRRA